jgi:hypothetical protein
MTAQVPSAPATSGPGPFRRQTNGKAERFNNDRSVSAVPAKHISVEAFEAEFGAMLAKGS